MSIEEFTTLRVNSLIDAGHKEDIDSTIEHIEKGDILEYLQEKYNTEIITKPEHEHVNNKLLEFVNAFSKGDIRGKYSVENNGLCLIITALNVFKYKDPDETDEVK